MVELALVKCRIGIKSIIPSQKNDPFSTRYLYSIPSNKLTNQTTIDCLTTNKRSIMIAMMR